VAGEIYHKSSTDTVRGIKIEDWSYSTHERFKYTFNRKTPMRIGDHSELGINRMIIIKWFLNTI
jgi:hypothetical protein